MGNNKYILGFIRDGALHLIKSIQGERGNRGNGIYSVEQTKKSLLDGGVNELLITETDGKSTVFEVQNGHQGPEGPTGPLSVYDSSQEYPPFYLANETGQDDTIGMTQKAITDAIDAMGTFSWANAYVQKKYPLDILMEKPASPSATKGQSFDPADYPMTYTSYIPEEEGDEDDSSDDDNGETEINDDEENSSSGRVRWIMSDRYQIYYLKVYAGQRLRLYFNEGHTTSSVTPGYVQTYISDKEPEEGKRLNVERIYCVGDERFSFIGNEDLTPEYIIENDGYFWVRVTNWNVVSIEKTESVKNLSDNNEKNLLALKEETSIFEVINTDALKIWKKHVVIYQTNGIPDAQPVWHGVGTTTVRTKFYKVGANEMVKISTSADAKYTVLVNTSKTIGRVPSYATGYNNILTLEAGNSLVFITPENGYYIYFEYINYAGEPTQFTIEKPRPISNTVEALKNTVSLLDTSTNISYEPTRTTAEALGNLLRPISYQLTSGQDPDYLDNWEIPQTIEERNIIIKANQMLNLVWTPKKTLNTRTEGVIFEAGIPVTGIPYSSVKEHDKFIGSDVSICTFLTAANNQYSLLYTEEVGSSHARSAWWNASEKYKNGTNCALYYGVVCSAFTGYATGQIIHDETAFFKWISENRFRIVKVNNQSAQSVRIGDLIWTQGHVRLVIGVKRNPDTFAVQRVRMAEARGLKTRLFPTYDTMEERIKGASASDFNTLFAANSPFGKEKGILYRSLELYKNINYEKGPFFNEDGTQNLNAVYNNDICTFAGDKATFREGEFVVLNYNLNDDIEWENQYTAIEVYKHVERTSEETNNARWELYNTYPIEDIDQSLLPEGQRGHALKIENLPCAWYAARVVSTVSNNSYSESDLPASGGSDYTYWEVLDTRVNYVRSGKLDVVTWETTNANAVGFSITHSAGQRAFFEYIAPSNIKASTPNLEVGEIKGDFVQMMDEVSAYATYESGSERYIKVIFRGRYGNTTNEPIPVSWTLN